MATAAPHPHPGFSGPPPGKRMRGIGRVLFWIGLVLVLASVTVGVIVAVMGFSRVAESAGNRIPVDGSAQVSVQQNERRLFFVPAEAHHSTGSDGETDTTYTPLAESNCTVEGPSAEELQVSGTHQFTENGRPNIADGGFIAREAGTYTVTCSPTPADAQVTVAPPIAVGQIVGGVGGVHIAVFGGLGFGLLTVLGLILWLVGRSTLRKHGAL
jgi:hypothetical protein